MNYLNMIKYKLFLALFLFSCGENTEEELKQLDVNNKNYSSASKDEFINQVLIKKCSSFRDRNIEKYSLCIKETKKDMSNINWELFDSLELAQQDNILSPCNSFKIRNPEKFSICLNNQLNSFQDLPNEIQATFKIPDKSKRTDNIENLDSLLGIFDRSNLNQKLLSGEEVFQMFEKSVFMILAKNQRNDSFYQGSAVAISSDMLFTNCHVVLDDNQIPLDIIAFANDTVDKQSWYNAIVFKKEPNSDKCILKSIQKKDLQYIPIGRKTSELNIGEQVMALGYPMANNLDFDSKYRAPLTLSKGIISAIRDINNVTHIQTDAFIIDGSSGGALLDMKGNLIGITTSGFEGTQLNFAIVTDEFKNF